VLLRSCQRQQRMPVKSLQNFYTAGYFLYTCFACFRDSLKSDGGVTMDGLYLVIVIGFFALTGLLVKLFEKV
jgi:hypothetical protein